MAREALISIPFCGLMTVTTVSTASSAAIA
jgi:hypothetical protein